MDHTIYTFNEFMLQTKNVLYVLIILILLAMPAIWKFLNPDQGEEEQDSNHHNPSHHGGA